jgi:hypothetical protein
MPGPLVHHRQGGWHIVEVRCEHPALSPGPSFLVPIADLGGDVLSVVATGSSNADLAHATPGGRIVQQIRDCSARPRRPGRGNRMAKTIAALTAKLVVPQIRSCRARYACRARG